MITGNVFKQTYSPNKPVWFFTRFNYESWMHTTGMSLLFHFRWRKKDKKGGRRGSAGRVDKLYWCYTIWIYIITVMPNTHVARLILIAFLIKVSNVLAIIILFCTDSICPSFLYTFHLVNLMKYKLETSPYTMVSMYVFHQRVTEVTRRPSCTGRRPCWKRYPPFHRVVCLKVELPSHIYYYNIIRQKCVFAQS